MNFRVIFLIIFSNLLRSCWGCIPPREEATSTTSTSSTASSAFTDGWSTQSTEVRENTISTKVSYSGTLTSSTFGSTLNFDSTETFASEPSTTSTIPSLPTSTNSDETTITPTSTLNTTTSVIPNLSTLLTTAPNICDCEFPGPVGTGNHFLSKLKSTKISACSYQILCDQNNNQNYLEAYLPPNFKPNEFNLQFFRFYPVFNADNTPIDYFTQFGMICSEKQWYITKVPGMVDTSPGANREKVNGTSWNDQGWRFRISEMKCDPTFG
ncbi:unnamed protein product [Caenorhabditis brenneri]